LKKKKYKHNYKVNINL